MAVSRLALAQRGIALADAVPGPAKMRRARAKGERTRGRTARPLAASGLTGPFLSPGSLTAAERLRLIDGIERVLEGVYTHLPLKRARYGFDPVQRLRILRSQIEDLSDDAFHIELADHDHAASRRAYALHRPHVAGEQGRGAAVPGRDDRLGERAHVRRDQGRTRSRHRRSSRASCWSTGTASRSIARCSATRPGSRWTPGQPARLGDPEPHAAVAAVRPAAGRALGHRRLSNRGGGDGTGQAKEIKLPWQIVDPSEIDPLLSGGPTGKRAKALRRTRAVQSGRRGDPPREDAVVRAAHADRQTGAGAEAAATRTGSRREPTADVIHDQRSPRRSRRCRSMRRAGRSDTCASTGSTRSRGRSSTSSFG